MQRLIHSSCCRQQSEKDGITKDANDAAINFIDEGNFDIGDTAQQQTAENSSQFPESFTDVPGASTGKGRTLAIIYTCKVCNTRSAKKFTERAYRHGVVLVRCPGCENLHLIADRLGMFEDKGEDGKGWDVEKALAEAGGRVLAVTRDNVLELTLDDVLGKKA